MEYFESIYIYNGHYKEETPIATLAEATVSYIEYPQVNISGIWLGICPFASISHQANPLSLHFMDLPKQGIYIADVWLKHLGDQQINRHVEMQGRVWRWAQ